MDCSVPSQIYSSSYIFWALFHTFGNARRFRSACRKERPKMKLAHSPAGCGFAGGSMHQGAVFPRFSAHAIAAVA
jgi:hypothetical protein